MKQRKYIKAHYRTVYSNKHYWHWRDHVKIYLFLFLVAVLFWQGKIAVHIAKVKVENKMYAYAHKPLISPLPLLADSMPIQYPSLVKELDFPTGKSWDDFKLSCKKIAKIYNFPVNVALAQAALESRRGTSNLAQGRNNYFGLGAYDANPNLAFAFDNPQQSIIYYMSLIRFNPIYAKAWAVKDSPKLMLEEIKNAGYATDPEYIAKVESMPEWSEE